MTWPPVSTAMSCSIALRRSPKPGALTATELNVPRILLTTSVARASPSMSSAMISERPTGLHHGLEQPATGLHRRDLAGVEQDVGVFEDGFLALGVGDEVRRDVALVELHALGELELGAERVRLLDRDDAVLADLVDGVGDDLADGRVGGRDGGDSGDLVLVVDLLGLRLDRLDSGSDGLLDALLQTHRVGAGGDVAHAVVDHRLGQNGGGGGAVTGYVVGLGGDLLHQLGAHVLERVVELDLLGDGHAVVGDGRCAELLVEHDVAALRPEGDLDRVGQLVDPGFEGATRLVVELQLLCHVGRSAHLPTIASTSRLVRINRSSPSMVTSVPPYFEYRTVSPTLMSSGMSSLVVAPAAGADSEHFALLRLLLGGVGDDQTGCGGLLGLVGLDDDAVIEGLEIHGCGPPLAWHSGTGESWLR